MNYKLVIARYNESLDWLVKEQSLYQNSIIYNKGEALGLDNEFRLSNDPNYTREGGTYLHYIINNYDNLPDYVFFSQADPFDHSPKFIPLLKFFLDNPDLVKPYQPLTYKWKADKFIPHPWHLEYNTLHDIGPYKIYVEQLNDRLLPTGQIDLGMVGTLSIFRQRNGIANPDDTLPYLFNRLNLPQPYVGYILFNYGAIFGVKKENILQNSLQFYRQLERFLFEHFSHGYILERLWYTIFRTTNKII